MFHYRANKAPDPELWLSLDEQERIRQAESFHRARNIKLPSVSLHAALHAVVENQIAEGLDPVVRAMARLQSQGLTRHDSIHAIGSVLATQLHARAKDDVPPGPESVEALYEAAIERLDAASWLALSKD